MTPSPIASVEQFKRALLAVRDKNLPESHFAMLKAQSRPGWQTRMADRLSKVR
jgi:hypothetical protein